MYIHTCCQAICNRSNPTVGSLQRVMAAAFNTEVAHLLAATSLTEQVIDGLARFFKLELEGSILSLQASILLPQIPSIISERGSRDQPPRQRQPGQPSPSQQRSVSPSGQLGPAWHRQERQAGNRQEHAMQLSGQGWAAQLAHVQLER